MSNKILFIGGSADGRHIESALLDHYHQIPTPGGGTEQYEKIVIRTSGGSQHYLYILATMPVADAFKRLTDSYVAPDKPARKPNAIEDKMLRLLEEQPFWDPEVLLERFPGNGYWPARFKLWDLLAERKVELTVDRQLKLLK